MYILLLTAKDILLYFPTDCLRHFDCELDKVNPFVFRKPLVTEIFDFNELGEITGSDGEKYSVR